MPYEALPLGTDYSYPSSMVNLDYTTSDPRSMARTNWLAAVDEGRQLNQYLQGYTGQQRGLSDYWAQQAASSYGGMTPGYTTDEQGNIVRESELKGYMTTPGQYEDMYLTGAEQIGMAGDPSSYRTVSPEALWDQTTQGSNNLQLATQGIQNVMGEATGQHAGLYSGAVDPEKLGVSSSYAPGQQATLAGGASAIRGTIDPTKLGLSSDFTGGYRLTPEMQQEMVNQAGRTVGSRFATLRDEAAARAAAQGNTSPAAIAAIEQRLNLQEAGVAGDTMAAARLAASSEAANRLKTQEQMRLDAERGIQTARTGAEQGLLSTSLATGQDIEKTRLGAEQELSRQIMAKAQELGTSYEEAAKLFATTNVATQKDVRDTGLATEKYITEQGSAQAQAADKAAADRAALIAQNRQATAQYVPAQQWGQGQASNEALSSRYANVAGARRADEQEKRAWETGNQQYYGNQAQAGINAMTNAYGAKQGAAQGATGQYLTYDAAMAAKPSLWEKIVGAGLGAISSAQSLGVLPKVQGTGAAGSGGTSKGTYKPF